MIQSLRFYKKAVSASVRSLMQYKFSFILNFLTYSFVLLSDILPIFVIMYHFKAIGGWGIYHIGALWGTVNIAIAFTRCFCVEIHNFQDYIIRGTFDNLLLRPWPTLLLLMSRSIQFFRLSGAAQGLIIMIFSLVKLQAGITTYLYLPVLILTGLIILFSLEVIIAATAFWFGRTGDLLVFLFYGPTNAAMYPLSIFPYVMRSFLTIWPVAFVGFNQLEYLLGYSNNPAALIVAPLVGIVSVIAALKLWGLGEKNYYSSGS